MMNDQPKQKPQHYVKLYKHDMSRSLNYKQLRVYGKGVYHCVWNLCRDGYYAGELCYPNGHPMTIDQIIEEMELRKGERADRVRKAIDDMFGSGLLFYNEHGCPEIRKYAEKTDQLHVKRVGPPPDVSVENGDRLSPGNHEESMKLPEGNHEVVHRLSEGNHEVVNGPGDIKEDTDDSGNTEHKQTTVEQLNKYITNNNIRVNRDINFSHSILLLDLVGIDELERSRIAKSYSTERIVEAIRYAIKNSKENQAGMTRDALVRKWSL